jgi:Ni/Co efflux regulator RcnB
MTKSAVKTLNWMGLMSGAGLIMISVSTFASTSALAAAPAVDTNPQVAEGQQQQQYVPPQQQQQKQKQQQTQQGHQPPQPQLKQQQARPSNRYDWAAYQPGRRPPQWQQYRQDFNPRHYEVNRDAERRYHWQAYARPRGWYYQRWVYGQVLPTLFWGREYWLDNYVDFGLINPPYGYVWVRDGDDALLVDVESGRILSVSYGVFYS